MKTRGDGEIFDGVLLFVQRGDFRRKFIDARAPGNELLADELIGALPAKVRVPGQDDGAGIFFFLELLSH